MANNCSQWEVSDASNNTGSAPDFPVEGQSPSSVNDTMRTIYGAVARWYQDTNGSLTTAGSSNAYTLTTNNSHAALADQSLLVFRADRANTGSATLNVDSLGAKSVRLAGSALPSGALKADKVYVVVYNATDDAYDLIGGVDHDELPGFVANEHVDHSSVSVSSGTGLTGGGTIAANRTLSLDTSNSRNVDHSGVSVTAGSGLTGGGTIESTRTLNVGAGTGITVNANDVAIDGGVLRHASLGSGSVTVQSGGSPSGGSNGDIYLIY